MIGENNLAEEIKRKLSIEHEYPPEGNVTRRGNDIQGVHPIHGSAKTGENYIVHTDSQTFHCFRCDSTGDVLDLVAMDEGIIECEEAGELTGNDFIETLEIASERAGVELEWDDYVWVDRNYFGIDEALEKRGVKL